MEVKEMAGCGCGCGGDKTCSTSTSTSTTTINIEGMSCAHCAGAVQRELAGLQGVKDVTVDLASKKAMISYEPGKVGNDQFKQAVEKAGYQVV
jgi:Cu+-exporting ATPase